MIVYVESNFVLELAFLQEESEDCSEILQLAEAQRIELVFPSFCVGEPYEDACPPIQRQGRPSDPTLAGVGGYWTLKAVSGDRGRFKRSDWITRTERRRGKASS